VTAAVAVVLLVIVAAVLVLAAMRPAEMRVERRASIRAPAERIHAQIADFKRWQAWSPWERIDPTLQRTYSGAASGKGAVYEWSGQGKAGAGRMEILDAPVPSKVVIQLDFIKPFPSRNATVFALAPRGDGTEVTWTMTGPSPFVARVMGVFMNLEGMVGRDFEAGLANLKAASEAA
jgi:hypothetical protein